MDLCNKKKYEKVVTVSFPCIFFINAFNFDLGRLNYAVLLFGSQTRVWRGIAWQHVDAQFAEKLIFFFLYIILK